MNVRTKAWWLPSKRARQLQFTTVLSMPNWTAVLPARKNVLGSYFCPFLVLTLGSTIGVTWTLDSSHRELILYVSSLTFHLPQQLAVLIVTRKIHKCR